MRNLIRIILFVLTIIIILAFVIMLSFLWQKESNNTPYFLGYTAFVNTGTSMLPTIKEGDLVIVKKQEQYKKDDIIAFDDDGLTVTHRIIDLKDNYYTTRGDNNTFTDGNKVYKLNVYGKMLFVVPGVGSAIIYLMAHKTLVIGLIIILIILFFVFRIGLKYVRKNSSRISR